MKVKIIICALLTIVIIYLENTKHDGNFHIYFLDVGQGDSTLIITPENKKILIDGGPDTKSINHLSKLLPFYDKKIDLIILTHQHKDHIFGLIPTLKRYKVEYSLNNFMKSKTPLHKQYITNHKENQTKYIKTQKHTDLLIGSTRINVLGPFSTKNQSNINNSSVSIQVIDLKSGTKAIFTGDAEKEQEKIILLSNHKSRIKSHIYQAGHHGSQTSSTTNLLRAISPLISVISYQKDNKYKHPSPQVLKRMEDSKIEVLNTSKGTIHIKI